MEPLDGRGGLSLSSSRVRRGGQRLAADGAGGEGNARVAAAATAATPAAFENRLQAQQLEAAHQRQQRQQQQEQRKQHQCSKKEDRAAKFSYPRYVASLTVAFACVQGIL